MLGLFDSYYSLFTAHYSLFSISDLGFVGGVRREIVKLLDNSAGIWSVIPTDPASGGRVEESPDFMGIFIGWGMGIVLTVGGCLRSLRSVDMTVNKGMRYAQHDGSIVCFPSWLRLKNEIDCIV